MRRHDGLEFILDLAFIRARAGQFQIAEIRGHLSGFFPEVEQSHCVRSSAAATVQRQMERAIKVLIPVIITLLRPDA